MLRQVAIFLMFLLISTNLLSQTSSEEVMFFSRKNQISKFYNISELEALKKGELIKIYQKRLEEVVTMLPFLSLTNEAGVKLSDVGIKEDSRHTKVLKGSKESSQKFLAETNLAIEELVAYADTQKIIRTILYYEEFIKKMRIGVNGNL